MITDGATASFIQKLRTLLCIRSLETLNQGFAREKRIGSVCIEVRKACENSADPRIKLLERVANRETDLISFCQSLTEGCESQLTRDDLENKDRQLYLNLRAIAQHGPWLPELLVNDLQVTGGWTPSFIQDNLTSDRTRNPLVFSAQNDSKTFHIVDPTENVTTILGFQTEPSRPPAGNLKIGSQLILSNLEEAQYLRHSWLNLSPSEEKLYRARHAQLLNSKDPTVHVGLAIVAAAEIAARSLSSAQKIAISKEVGGDWALNPSNGTLHRTPARFERRWDSTTKDPSVSDWIHPLSKLWTVKLHPKLALALVEITQKRNHPATLGELWKFVSPDETLEEWFEQSYLSMDGLRRLTQRSIAQQLSTGVFEQTHNQSFAQLMGSQPRTALPSACAYGAYRSPAVFQALSTAKDLYAVSKPSSEDDLNDGGSDLDVDIDKLRDSVCDLQDRIATASDWVQHHNLLTCYVVLSLLASTGSRPINSPFESLSQFDFIRSLVFVQDKVSGPTLSARVCVLSASSRKLLLEVYLPHLSALADAVEPTAPKFAEQIRKVLGSDQEAELPLLFFVRQEPKLDWIEVTERQMEIEGKLAWPLPGNLFRHIHATQLPRMKLEAEILDALLGHGDRGAESWGDYSLRIPREDVEHARTHVEQLFAQFGFKLPVQRIFTTQVDSPLARSVEFREAKSFGITARKQAREKSQLQSAKQALKDIEQAVGKRPADSLCPDDWQKIALAMLFRPDGLPYSNSSIRYQEFERFIDGLWQRDRVLTKIRRAYRVLPPAQSIFNKAFIAAPTTLSEIELSLQATTKDLPTHKLSANLVSVLAAIELILYARVAHKKALYSLICQLDNTQLVKLKGKYYFEWSDSEVWKDGRPTFRVAISNRCAHWIALSKLSARKLREFPSTPESLKQIVPKPNEPNSLKRFLDRLIEARDQMNVWELPGTDAAYLSGRQLFPALPHLDWFRKSSQEMALLPSLQETQSDGESVDDTIFFMERHHKAGASNAKVVSATTCSEFMKDLHVALVAGDKDANGRVADVSKLLMSSQYGHGDIPFVFAHFGLHLLKRKKKKGAKAELSSVTVKRYLASLSGPICDLCFDKSFVTLDEEEITELYSDMLEWWSSRDSEKLDSSKPTNDRRLSPAEAAADAARRTLAQLKDFHQFAERVYAADMPDWSEISVDGVGAIGRPGYILHKEYQRAIAAILGGREPMNLPDADLGLCGTLLLCKRFGLRLGEAVGTERSDWIDSNGAIVLLVRPNSIRTLKSTNSKRQVPLIGILELVEVEVIGELIRRNELTLSEHQTSALIPDVSSKTFVVSKNRIGTEINLLLRKVTCNPNSVLHFARHSFATNVLELLRGSANGETSLIPGADSESTRRLLLSRTATDRRSLWAVCRLLGHGSPGVTARCYLHGIEEFVPPPKSIGDWDGQGRGYINVLDLDVRSINPEYGVEVRIEKSKVAQRTSAFLKILQFLSLRAQGLPLVKALITTQLSQWTLQTFVCELEASGFHAESTHSQSHSESQDSNEASRPGLESILEAIPIVRLAALCTHSTKAPFDVGSGHAFRTHETIGKRRQIVLFLKEHFLEFQNFMTGLNLSETDLITVGTSNRNAEFLSWSQSLKLPEIEKENLGKSFQLDTAFTGSQKHMVRERLVVVPTSTSGLLNTRIELVLLWLAWRAIRSPMHAPVSL
ncbi:MAG: hypothetical protein CFE44_01655 [Burkholderiales bacterium PBB4]|nr:MAG: hypothetical protein CFE44_01655 [Burkholderiales bacterium PBB4]